jgi:hypothetical protein
MESIMQLVFFVVFFVPMGALLTLGLLLHRPAPDVIAPWVPLAASTEPEPARRREARLPAPVEVAENDDESLQVA